MKPHIAAAGRFKEVFVVFGVVSVVVEGKGSWGGGPK